MPSSESSRAVNVGLVSQADAINQHLKQALAELGARIVYDTPASHFDYSALEASGAEVVVVNLDPDVEEFDALDQLLADEKRRVVINDGEVSSKLSGWDQARWARHLASKILGVGDLNPPRPEGAQAVQVRARPGAPEYSGAQHEDLGLDISAADLARALDADTGETLAQTKAALVTDLEPTPATLQEREESLRAPGHDIPGLDEAYGTPVPESSRAAPSASGFTMFEDEALGSAALESAPIEDLGDFGGLLLEPLGPEAGAPPTDKPTAAEPSASKPAASATPPADEFNLGGFSLEPLSEEAAPAAATAAPAAKPAASPGPSLPADWGDLGAFSLEPLSEETPPPVPAAAAVPSAKAVEQPKAPSAAAKSEWEDLGDFSLEPLSEDEISAAATPAPKPAVAAKPTPPAAATAPKPAVEPAPTADWADLGSFSLEPLDEGGAEDKPAPAPAAKSTAASKASALDEFDLGGFSLEPAEEELPAAPAPTAASRAAPAPVRPAPPRSEPSPPVAPKAAPVETNAASLAGLDLEFAAPADTFKFSDFGSEAELEPANVEADDELMKQFQAIFSGEEYSPPLEAGPVQRVWVLGASIGGPEAVREFLAALPPDLPVLFLLAQHMGSDFVDLMTQQLSRATKYRVRLVGDGELVAHGDVVVAPLSERLRISAQGEATVTALEQVSSYTPSIDQVLKDVADAFGRNAGVIIFSGMAHDAIEGARYLHGKGGQVWAQDPRTCVVSSMVDGAIEAGVVSVKGAPVELAQRFAALYAGK